MLLEVFFRLNGKTFKVQKFPVEGFLGVYLGCVPVGLRTLGLRGVGSSSFFWGCRDLGLLASHLGIRWFRILGSKVEVAGFPLGT